MSRPLVGIRDLVKIYSMGEVEVRALDGVDLEVGAGEFVAVMGPSGSGKSTLMNIIGCLDRPTSGQYILNNEEVSRLLRNELAGVRNRFIGFVFQGFNLLSRTTALENAELPLIYAGLTAKERHDRARHALERVGLGDRKDHYPSQLSGGQQQRVAIARALINNPALIVADEPTGNLDSRSGFQLMELLSELHREGRTILMVTHDSRMEKYASSVIYLMDGRVASQNEFTTTNASND